MTDEIMRRVLVAAARAQTRLADAAEGLEPETRGGLCLVTYPWI